MADCRRECGVRLRTLQGVLCGCADVLAGGLVACSVACSVCGQSFDWQSLAGETGGRAVANVPEYE